MSDDHVLDERAGDPRIQAEEFKRTQIVVIQLWVRDAPPNESIGADLPTVLF
jgi:hypothetical protein